MKREEVVKLSVLGAAVILTYIPTILWMVDRWNERDTYYSHGLLVPFICGYLVWHKRKELAALRSKPAMVGWVLFGVGMLVHAVSSYLRVYFTSGFSLFLTIPGLVLIFLGKEYLKKVWFAIAFLIFMIPLPLVAIANISFRLKIFAAQCSTTIVNWFGIRAIRDGSVIRTMHSDLAVEDPCSGIKSLIALIALGALMAYFSSLSKPKKMALFIASVPIAVGCNIIRIVSLTLVSEIYGSKYAMGLFHDTMGVMVFVLAFTCMAVTSKLLE